MHPEISTPRPPILYNQQPTLRLRPVHTYKATRRPIYVTTPAPAVSPTSSHTVEITPKFVYVSGKPPTGQNPELPLREPSTVTPIKLKPVYKYAHERPPLTPAYVPEDQDQLPDIRTSSLAEILHKLQASNHLPQTLTPDNIDNSIKTLIRILQNLKQTQTIVANPPQHHDVATSRFRQGWATWVSSLLGRRSKDRWEETSCLGLTNAIMILPSQEKSILRVYLIRKTI